MSVKNKHFAEAIVQSVPDKNVSEVLSSLHEVSMLIKKTKQLQNYLFNPKYSLSDKKEVLASVFKKHLSAEGLNIVMMIVKNDALDRFDELLLSARRYYLEKNNLQEAVVESIIHLTASQIQELSKVLEQKFSQKMIIKNVINQKIQAGLVVKINDLVIDVSLKNKLNKLSLFIK
jgi:F-type H+-transporting ATPase subunit delta